MNYIAKVAGDYLHWPLFFVLVFITFSCDEQLSEDAEKTLYSGPLRTINDAEIVHSDSGRLKAKIIAKQVLNFQNEDREAPDGLFITFFEKDGAKSATLEADYAYYTKEKKIWKAQGNVIIRNMKNEETLKTEELFWDPQTGDVSTEKFVKIETPEEIITGTGLDAKQDFSSWSLKHPEGIFVIEDEEGSDDL
ncbi:MAG: LPS export ABC transporter periplasmic protein LptC [Bacteroidota bacterium]